MKIASSITLDWNHGVTIDGIEFPFYVGEDVAIEPGGHGAIAVVSLEVFVDGVIDVRTRDGERRLYDPVEGDVAAWARRLVRDGLLERLPDLVIPEETR